MSLEEVADECWDTLDVLSDRLADLEPEEERRLVAVVLARCDAP